MNIPPDAIDFRTVLLLITCVSATTTTAMLLLWRGLPDEPSVPPWALGSLLITTGFLGIALHGWAPSFTTYVLANVCITVGHACFLNGVSRLAGRTTPTWPAMVVLALAIAGAMSYFSYVQDSAAARMAIQFVAIGSLSLVTGARLLRGGAALLPHRVVAGVFVAYGLALLIRVALIPYDPPQQNLFTPSAIHALVFVGMLIFYASMMCCFPALLFAKEVSGRIATERALRDSDEAYRTILTTSPDGFWLASPDGRLLDVNDHYARQSGYGREELLKMRIIDLEAAETEEDTAGHIRKIIATGSDQFESRHRRKDGSIWNVEVSVIYLASGGGKFFVFVRDISARKQAETAIVEARNQLEATLNAIPDLLLELGIDGRYYEVYARDKSLLVAPPEIVLGKTVSEVLPPDASEVVMAALREAKAEGQSHGRKFRLALADGDHWFELSVAPKFTEPGHCGRFIVISRDITERTLAENALRVTSERLKEAQRIARIGSWELDLVSGKLSWSDEVFRLFEIDQARFGATYVAFLSAIHPEDRETVNKAYTDSLWKRTPYEITYRLLMADGRIKWVQERCSSEFDVDGNPLRSSGTVQDITEQKEAEEQLRIAAAAFESRESMVITDAQSVILRVNRAFTETTGYSAEDAVGQTPRMLQSGRHDSSFFREMWDSIRRTGCWEGEIWDKRKNGEIYPKWLTISAVKNDEGIVTHYIGTHHDITKRKEREEKINELAFFDQLTGLPNRTLLLDRLRQTLTATSRNASFGALLFIDLDNFKTLNDTLGHDVGDLLLKQVAMRLSRSVREGDTVARLGGDEFVVVLAGLGAIEADAGTAVETVAEKILAALNQTYPLGAVAHHSTASIGVTLFRGDRATVDDLMKQADLAMYKSKEAGRNRVRFFDPTLESAVKERAVLEDDLRQALARTQFLLQYQPQVAGRRQITGVEALVRWQHPTRGMVSPADFIPLAEETGLILPLGRWVLETACAQLAVWAGQPAMARITISVNVSPRQFHQKDFVDQVLAVLHRTGANPQQLKLELTESLLVENVQDIIAKMFALKAKGIGFSLDDFGTGYSSLSYLKKLPLDQLKIDQSFVRDVLVDANDAAIARTVVALAQSLGLGVIAEGVESEAQLEFLAASGCHAYQGYLFSRPLSVDDFERFVRRG